MAPSTASPSPATVRRPRAEAFAQALAAAGVHADTPATVLCDGDAGLWRLQRETLPGATVVLDWWHAAMRFEHALQAARGLADTHLSNEAVRGLERAKWRLWHGRWTGCRRKLEALSRWTKRKHLRDVAGIERIQQHVSELPVPVYADAVAEEIAAVLDHSGAAIVIAQDQEQIDKILSVRDQLPKLTHLLHDEMRGLTDYDEPGLEALSAIAAKGRAALADPAVARDLDRRIDAGRGADPSVILYTSGTTGRSKGVVLSGERSISAARHTVAFDRLTDRDEALAYLPLAWVGDHYLNYAQGYVAGFCIACPEGAETVANDLREIGPTYHFAPPRVFEALLTRVVQHGPINFRAFNLH